MHALTTRWRQLPLSRQLWGLSLVLLAAGLVGVLISQSAGSATTLVDGGRDGGGEQGHGEAPASRAAQAAHATHVPSTVPASWEVEEVLDAYGAGH